MDLVSVLDLYGMVPGKNITAFGRLIDMKKTLTKEDVEITIECLPEHVPVHGNVMASGDNIQDKETEDHIVQQLETGNEWAWCIIKVTAKWHNLESTTHLGGCSYKSEEDFTQEEGYYDDMVQEVIDNLNQQVE